MGLIQSPLCHREGGEDVQWEMKKRTRGNRGGGGERGCLRSALANRAIALRFLLWVVRLILENGKFPFNLLGRISAGKNVFAKHEL